MPAMPAISSRVNSSARWLSINQSAFWAGFMEISLIRSAGIMTVFRATHLIVLALIDRFSQAESRAVDPRCAKAVKSAAGNATSTVHTGERILIRRLTELPLKRLPEPSASTSGRTIMHYRVFNYAKSVALAGVLAFAVAGAANAQKKYDPGATDTEIKVGNIMPYSGPLSAYATIGKTEAAYFKKINEEGGIDRKSVV